MIERRKRANVADFGFGACGKMPGCRNATSPNSLILIFIRLFPRLRSVKGRIPPEKYALWSKALNVDAHEFAINIVKYYNPFLYDLLFPAEDGRKKTGASKASPALEMHELHEEIRDLQRLLGEKTLENARLHERLPQNQGDAVSVVEKPADKPKTRARPAARKGSTTKD